MGIVTAEMSMSLDGFVADPDDGVGDLHRWYSSGDVATQTATPGVAFRTSAPSADVLREALANTGALITGRRNFDIAGGWGGTHPLGVPVVVVTHTVPGGWPRDGIPFVFVNGIERAVAEAKEQAGGKTVVVASPSIAQQCLNAGLLDEISVSLVPVLLGSGIRFFGKLGNPPVWLDRPRVVEGPGVTHLQFTVHKHS